MFQLECFNDALLAKHISRVFSNPEHLLCQVILAKYGRGELEDITRHHTNQSWRRKDVQSSAEVITGHLFRQIGTGEKFGLRSKFW